VSTPKPSLEVRAEITDLFAAYAWALDTGDIELLLSIFTPDGAVLDEVFTPASNYHGHEQLRRFGERFRDDPYFPGRQHHLTQTLYEPHDAGWRARSFVLSSDCDGDPPYVLAFAGWYDDVLVDTADGWRFQQRAIRIWQGDVLSRMPHAPSKASQNLNRVPENYRLPGDIGTRR
jgi:hypothetical protein